MTEMTSPPAGWYPAPHAGGQQRFWDGTRWVDEPASDAWSAEFASPSPSLTPVHRPVRGIALATQILIAASVPVSVVRVFIEGWGLTVVERFTRGEATVADLEAYDVMVALAGLVWAATIISAGICWWVWQYRAAMAVRAGAPAAIRRTPAWHVLSWIIPIVSLWFPYQNMRDVVVAVRADVRGSVLALWWGLWIASMTASTASNWIVQFADTLEAVSASMWTTLIGEVLLIAAAAPAILILRRTTAALEGTRA
jgi:hypothetical protein